MEDKKIQVKRKKSIEIKYGISKSKLNLKRKENNSKSKMSGIEDSMWSSEEDIISKIRYRKYDPHKNQYRVKYAYELMDKGRELGKYSEEELVEKIMAHYELNVRFAVKKNNNWDWNTLINILSREDAYNVHRFYEVMDTSDDLLSRDELTEIMEKGKYDPLRNISRKKYIKRIWSIAQLFN